jgi:hypothetical protein
VKKSLVPQFLRSAYRREPISSFLLTVGTVDAVMGGVAERSSLMAVGLGTVGVAIALRLLAFRSTRQERPIRQPQRTPVLYLPEQSSRPALPLLGDAHKHSSN